MDQRHTTQEWRRSSRCSNGVCVEVAKDGETWLIRDSKIPGGPILEFSDAEADNFFGAVKDGEFDKLAA